MRRSFNVTGILGESKFSHQPRSQGPLSRSRERTLGTRLFSHYSEMLQSLECKLVLVGVTRCRLEILISTSLIWTTGRLTNDVNVDGQIIPNLHILQRETGVLHVLHECFSYFVHFATVLVLSTASLRNDDTIGNDNATKQWFDWLNEGR